MVCNVFVCAMWKASGMFDDQPAFECGETTNWDIESLNIFDSKFERPAACVAADPDLPYCQIAGNYRVKLPSYNQRALGFLTRLLKLSSLLLLSLLLFVCWCICCCCCSGGGGGGGGGGFEFCVTTSQIIQRQREGPFETDRQEKHVHSFVAVLSVVRSDALAC